MPARLVIVGGGVVGCEMAAAWSALGSRVTLLVREAGCSTGCRALRRGARARPGCATRASTCASATVTERVGPRGPGRPVRWRSLGGGTVIGRTSCSRPPGALPRPPTSASTPSAFSPGRGCRWTTRCRVDGVAGGWLYAAGDVNHLALLTHMGKYQARVCGDAIAARAERARALGPRPGLAALGAPGRLHAFPRSPAVGLTAEQARGGQGPRPRRSSTRSATWRAPACSPTATSGHAQLVVDEDRQVIVGLTLAGPGVGEMIHAATIAVAGEVPLSRLWHAVPVLPTMSELWLRLLETYGLLSWSLSAFVKSRKKLSV